MWRVEVCSVFAGKAEIGEGSVIYFMIMSASDNLIINVNCALLQICCALISSFSYPSYHCIKGHALKVKPAVRAFMTQYKYNNKRLSFITEIEQGPIVCEHDKMHVRVWRESNRSLFTLSLHFIHTLFALCLNFIHTLFRLCSHLVHLLLLLYSVCC